MNPESKLQRTQSKGQWLARAKNNAYATDIARVNKILGSAMAKYKPRLIKEKSKELSKLPRYKQIRKSEMSEGAAALGGTAGLATLLSSKGWKKRLIGAGAGAGVGALYGLSRAKRRLKRTSEKVINKQVSGLLAREHGKTQLAHRVMGAPGLQSFKLKRPWGKESYAG